VRSGPPSIRFPAPLPSSRQWIGRYEIVEELGRGAVGCTYRCLDRERNRYVAVKIALEDIPSAEERDRFLRRAERVMTIRHQHICPIEDYGSDGTRPFIVSPFVDGGNLADWRRANRLPPIPEALDRVLGLVRGVAALHSAGIVHRALKPSNILVDGDHLLITDHGWAATEDDETARNLSASRYMSPEQWRTGGLHRIGPRSDLFTIGILLFELLTNAHPYPWLTEDVLAQGVAAWTQKPRAPSEVLYGLDQRLDALCLAALPLVPGDRYASAEAFGEEIVKCRESVSAGLLITAKEDFDKGERFYYGAPGTPRDPKKARGFFERAAAQGYAPAQNSLGCLYQHALGVPRDYERACELYQKAADQGNARAQNNLGYMYLKGFGVERSLATAFKLYKKAARQGDAAGQYNLGSMYMHAMGVPLNYDLARQYYEMAADQGFAKAQNGLGFMFLEGLGVEVDYEIARAYFEMAAKQGFGLAQNSLGYMYLKGFGVEIDYAVARQLFEKAAGQGIAQAYNALGYMHQYGLSIEQNFAKARELFEKAAKKGLPEAFYNLGFMYQNALGVRRNPDRARSLYEKAAARGDEDAQKALEKMDGE
jgi:TPR repeat protein